MDEGADFTVFTLLDGLRRETRILLESGDEIFFKSFLDFLCR